MTTATLTSLVIIMTMVVLSPILAELLSRWIRIPLVVFEITLGIAIGPSVLDWAIDDDLVTFLSNLGLATLIFIAGTEVDLKRIEGPPLRHGVEGWLASLGLGLAVGAALIPLDGARSALVVGLAVTTTSLGTLLPILRDRGELSGTFGTEVLAGSAIGEFGPIVAVALLLTSDRPGRTAIFLATFIASAVLAAYVASRSRSRIPPLARLLETSIDTSGQLAIRIVVLTMVGMVWIADELSLDVLLGAFAGGIVFRLFATGASEREAELVEAKLNGLGFGFVIPFFFVVSGIRFDLGALGDLGVLVRVPLFVVVFLVVRGAPALVVYRRTLGRTDRAALGFFLATQLPLVVAITAIGVETDQLDSGSAAALVGAAMVSVLVFPLIGVALRDRGGATT